MKMKSTTRLLAVVLGGSLSLLVPPRASAQVRERDGGVPPDTAITPAPPAQMPPSHGQEAGVPDTVAYILETIEATATRERATAPPVATITVDPVTIRHTHSENPYDLIRRVANLEVHDQGQGPGFASNVVMRGFTNDHSSDLLLVVDGVPVNLPVHGHVEGYADWNFLFPGAVSSLRVIHGPSSPLYGDFSVAGAVELYTQAEGDGVEANVSTNHFGDLSGWVTAGKSGPSSGGLLGLDLRRTEGWREHSNRLIGNVLLRGWRSVGEGRLEGGVALHGANGDAPGFVSQAEFESRELEQAANQTDGGEQARAAVHGRWATPLGGDRYLQVMGWGVASTWDLFLTTPGHEDAFGNLYQAAETDRRWGAGSELELSWNSGGGEFTLGTSVRTDRSEYDKDRTLRRRSVEEEISLDAEHTAGGAFLRWRRTILDRLGLDFGGRVDHLRYKSFNRFGLDPEPVEATLSGVPVPPVYYHIVGSQGPVGEWVSGNETVWSPKLGARLALTDRWTLMASSSRGFRSSPGVLGDPERPPMIAWAQELGLAYERPGLESHVSLFRSDVSNERIQDPITLQVGSAGSSVRQGFEGMLSVDAPGGVTLFGRGTYTDATLSGRYADAHHDHATDEESEPTLEHEDGQRVPGIAKYLAQISATVPLRERLEGRIEWRVSGPYVPIGEPDVTTGGFSLLDAGLTFPVQDAFIVDVEMRNVLDKVYPEIRASGYVNPGAPRSLAVSVHYVGRNDR